MLRKVYVLGAGASKGVNENAPLMQQLSNKVWEMVLNTEMNDLGKLKQFLEDFYPEPSASNYVGLETILSQLDFSILENRPLSSKYPVDIIRQLRNNLIYVMCKVLQSNLSRNDCDAYDKMCKLVDKFLGSLDKDDVIISLNYDLIIDNRILDGPRKRWHRDHEPLRAIDYGTDIRAYADRSSNKVRLSVYPPPTSDFKLYKLHGSLNWLLNPALKTIDVTRLEKGAVSYIFEPNIPELASCPKSGIRYEPVLITPSFLKDYNNRHIQAIWDGAEMAIREANVITFVGYSLPDADMVLRCMLKRAIFGNKLRPKIKVIDKNDEDQNDVRKRYEQLFGSIEYDKNGFDTYIENELV